MRPPDTIGRCAICTFPADQLLYEGQRCIQCLNRCRYCHGSGRVQVCYTRLRRYSGRKCRSCEGSGRVRWAA
jgi:DnaJ-class molecular chaperone